MPDSSPRISREDVVRVARLARLALTDSELDLFTGQLASVLDHASDIAALDVAEIAPMTHPYLLANVLRRDEVDATVNRDEVLGAAPATEAGCFRVPPILSEEPWR